MMNAVETQSPASGAETASSSQGQDGEDPQQTKPRPAALFENLKRLLRLGRPATSLRENLEDELSREGGTDTAFSPEERLLLGNILRLRELRVDDVMIPRADIDAVDYGTSLSRVMELFEDSGHSRMPVYDDTLDDPRGMVHIKDLMAYIAEKASEGRPATSVEKPDDGEAKIPEANGRPGHNLPALDLSCVDLSVSLKDTQLLRNVLFVPPSMPATDLMAKMQAGRIQMALVIDEYGGTDGLVSLEDLVEEVVGDIEDEHDEDEEAMLAPAGDGLWIADPRLPLEDVDEALGTKLIEGGLSEDVDTLGGLLYVSVGRVPVRGELLHVSDVNGFEFEIMDADPRRIKRLKIRRRRSEVRQQDIRRRPKRADDSAETETQKSASADDKPDPSATQTKE
ncbi:HlyC/CorC family transporter [Roseibium denhamense]|uniref:CBS domain-containing protein n=1 Tax=Roseibium denhamense TaxID=76305 RepID=A0ABY1PLC5_9HYPH|nr:hemolysin family protein [Roseibium denhamense]MTI06935.1 HlyC/CorC family transporter [Roseibium denhamense]SMP36732.1 CBS domain-containing protein [Roseibium denhamense]